MIKSKRRTNFIKLSLNEKELKKVYELLNIPKDNTRIAKEIRAYLIAEYDSKYANKDKKNDV